MSTVIQWLDLGKNVWMEIFTHIPIGNFTNISLVCKDFSIWTSEDYVWKVLFTKKFDNTQSVDRSLLRGWKDLYRDALTPQHNLIYGNTEDHKLCLHIDKKCYQDPFWQAVYHHGKSYSRFLDDVHRSSIRSQSKKVLFLGNSNIGKHSMIDAFATMEKPSYTSLSKDKESIWINFFIQNELIRWDIFFSDFEEEKKKDNFFSSLLSNYDAILVFFSIVDIKSFNIVEENITLIKKKSKNVILIGTHLDMTIQNPTGAVTYGAASTFAKDNKLSKYFEISSWTLTNLSATFLYTNHLILGVLPPLSEKTPTTKSKKDCIIF